MNLFEPARKRYESYLLDNLKADGSFRFTRNADSSPYTLCFGIFGFALLKNQAVLDRWRAIWSEQLRKSALINSDREPMILARNKPFMQLLTFSLSAASVVAPDSLPEYRDIALKVLQKRQSEFLSSIGTLEGRPGSGNLAMFQGIILAFARDWLQENVDSQLEEWVDFHLRHQNEFGFWGSSTSSPYLQFQNGYHQYEIFEYLNRFPEKSWCATKLVHSLGDKRGHFAPYPGGGGCFDYDAAFLLTLPCLCREEGRDKTLIALLSSLLAEQNEDGGFGESITARSPKLNDVPYIISRLIDTAPGAADRWKKTLSTLVKPSRARISTHWTHYSRRWNESNLWDSWFRMLTIARIDCHFGGTAENWGFIPFPGIGYHHSLLPLQRKL